MFLNFRLHFTLSTIFSFCKIFSFFCFYFFCVNFSPKHSPVIRSRTVHSIDEVFITFILMLWATILIVLHFVFYFHLKSWEWRENSIGQPKSHLILCVCSFFSCCDEIPVVRCFSSDQRIHSMQSQRENSFRAHLSATLRRNTLGIYTLVKFPQFHVQEENYMNLPIPDSTPL